MSSENEVQKTFSFGWAAYQQIAAFMGACSLVIFLGHYVHIDWYGIFGALIAVWHATVVPAVKFLLDQTVVAFLKWAFHWNIVVPPVVRDYVTVGLVLGLSYVRTMVGGVDTPKLIGVTVMNILLWPILTLLYLLVALTSAWTKSERDILYNVVLTLLPFLYAVLMIVADYYMHNSWH